MFYIIQGQARRTRMSGNNKFLESVASFVIVVAIANRVFPYIMVLMALFFVFEIGNCSYHKITNQPAIVRPQVDLEFQGVVNND